MARQKIPLAPWVVHEKFPANIQYLLLVYQKLFAFNFPYRCLTMNALFVVKERSTIGGCGSRLAKKIESPLHYPSISSTQMRRWNETRAVGRTRRTRKRAAKENQPDWKTDGIDWCPSAGGTLVWDAEAKGSERAGISRTKTDRKDTGLVGRIIKIHKITDAVAISDALLTLAIQSRPRDACKFSSGGRSLATFFVECHCVYCGPIATSYPSASRAHTPHPSKGPPSNHPPGGNPTG